MAQTKMDEVLKERGNRYGSYADNAEFTETVRKMVDAYLSQNQRVVLGSITPEQMNIIKHSLTLIMMKIARVIQGDPLHMDNLVDIEGYARIMRENLEETIKNGEQQ